MSHREQSSQTAAVKGEVFQRRPLALAEQALEENRQLKEHLAAQSAEHNRVAERLAAIENSLTWAIARRLGQRRWLTEESWRRTFLRLAIRGLRLWRREGVWAVCRRIAGKLLRRLRRSMNRSANTASVEPLPEKSEAVANLPLRPSIGFGLDRTGGARVPSERKFRVVFLGSETREFQSMRYRGHHVVEALALAELEARFIPEEEILECFSSILAHDAIVLVRLMYDEVIAQIIEAAQQFGIPVIYDIDDYLFEPWILPYVEGYRARGQVAAMRTINLLDKCLDHCDYFTGSTPPLVERAVARGKKGFLLHNGLNAAQIELSCLAREQRQTRQRDDTVRIGYFSGTRTHQADFRIVYPALMAILSATTNTRLVIVGYLDVGEFPGLMPFADRIDMVPACSWRELPAEIAQVDINLIPLEMTPFNEAKSNLKYYEAGAVGIPSIASPTPIFRESITHGHNGLLARTTEEWYDNLKMLVSHADVREEMGQNAFTHVMRTYAPSAIALEARETYRQIIRIHRARRGIPQDALNVVILLRCAERERDHWESIFHRANELTAEGHAVTVLTSPHGALVSAAALEQFLVENFGDPRFAVQLGEEIPCCDVLLAADLHSMDVAKANAHRAALVVSLPSNGPILALVSQAA